MATPSTQVPYVRHEGFVRASRSIARALLQHQDLALMIVQVRDVEKLCASFGHCQAAALIDDFHARLSRIGNAMDTIERISDRKFVISFSGVRNRGHATLAARKIERVAQQADTGHDAMPDLRLNIGVVLHPKSDSDPYELLRLAEIASLDARRNNDSVSFYEEQSAQQLFDELGLQQRLQHALDSGDLEVHFQPKTCIRSNKIVGAEGLMRWFEPEYGPISPEIFINIAESTGQIIELTQFAVQTACRRMNEWAEMLPELRVAVNITPSFINSTEIIDVLQNATKIWNICPDRLILEITENALIDDRETTHNVLTQIRALGCHVSIDDFGTGYSSLAYLRDIPADELKIDRTFVSNMLKDSGDYKIVDHAIRIAKSFSLSVVAEGIEDKETLIELQKLGCDYAQGYYVCKPLPANEFVNFCRDYVGANG